MKKIDLSTVPSEPGGTYPRPFDEPCSGEETLRPGDCAAFKSGDPDGHHLVNKSGRPARVLEIGTTAPQDRCTYPDIDMIADHRGYTHRDGTPYPLKK
jgi:uncharacterized cupin superfamily protein